MNIFTLLSERATGLNYDSDRVFWVESTASESSVDMEEDEADFDVLLLSNVNPNDYVIVRADAEVINNHDGTVGVRDINGTKFTFECYKTLHPDDINALLNE